MKADTSLCGAQHVQGSHASIHTAKKDSFYPKPTLSVKKELLPLQRLVCPFNSSPLTSCQSSRGLENISNLEFQLHQLRKRCRKNKISIWAFVGQIESHRTEGDNVF